jgi:hypothetical protein
LDGRGHIGGTSAAVLQEGELLACWAVSGEYLDRRIEYFEPMGGAHGDVHEVALGEAEGAVIDVEDGIAVLHVEPLISFLMDVRRRPLPTWTSTVRNE